MHLGPVAERRGVARKLAAELIHRADQLMYNAKAQKAEHVHPVAVQVVDGALLEMPGVFEKTPESAARASAARR